MVVVKKDFIAVYIYEVNNKSAQPSGAQNKIPSSTFRKVEKKKARCCAQLMMPNGVDRRPQEMG